MSFRKPLVSVVMSVYNGESYIKEAIDSILNQTFDDFELIIINDGSSDGSKEIILSYSDIRINFIENYKNIGLPASLNKGISNAKGIYIARMDSDDISDPERLFNQVTFLMNNPLVVAVGSWVNLLDFNGKRLCVYKPPVLDSDLRKIIPATPFVHPSVMFKRNAFFEAGGYPEYMLWGGEDAILFYELSKIGMLHNLDKVLFNYRLVPGAMSRKTSFFQKILSDAVIEYIQTSKISSIKLSSLENYYFYKTFEEKMSAYFFELLKLCLWSGAPRRETIKYIKEYITYSKLKFFKKINFIALSFLFLLVPRILLSNFYFKFKNRVYSYE